MGYEESPFPVLYTCEASLIIAGNLVVLVLYVFHQKWLKMPHYRCILNLTMADILTGVSLITNPYFSGFGLPKLQPTATLHEAEIHCKLLWARVVVFGLGAVSLYTCLMLAFERWLAIKKPLFYKLRFKAWHMNTMIFSAWLIGFLCSIPVLVNSKPVSNTTTGAIHCASMQYTSLYIAFVVVGGEFVIPFTLLAVLYIDIWRAVKKSTEFGDSARINNESTARLRKITKMAAFITIFLMVSWLPHIAIFLLFMGGLMSQTISYDNFCLLIFVNNFLNPFIYVFSNDEFKKAFLTLFIPKRVRIALVKNL